MVASAGVLLHTPRLLLLDLFTNTSAAPRQWRLRAGRAARVVTGRDVTVTWRKRLCVWEGRSSAMMSSQHGGAESMRDINSTLELGAGVQ